MAWLSRTEVQALLNAPDRRTSSGIRDRAMLHLAFAGGLRVSELVGLTLDQFDGRPPASIHIIGKGRRERMLPLWQERCCDPCLDSGQTRGWRNGALPEQR